MTKNIIVGQGGPLTSYVQLSLWAFLKTPHIVFIWAVQLHSASS